MVITGWYQSASPLDQKEKMSILTESNDEYCIRDDLVLRARVFGCKDDSEIDNNELYFTNFSQQCSQRVSPRRTCLGMVRTQAMEKMKMFIPHVAKTAVVK